VAFHNNVFPLELSALTPKTSWQTQVTELGGGAEQRAGLWADARRRYDARNADALTLAQYNQIEKHFNARRGKLFSFPLRDRSSFTVTGEPLGTGGGVASTNQLTINRGDAGNAYNREIYLPESGTIHIFAGASEKFEGTDWTLAYSGATAGTVTWLVNVTGLTLTWTGQFFIPVRYDVDELPDSKLFVWSPNNTGLISGPEIPLIEVRYPSEF
jgi:uncharacterized protein (TIGR02217 family)